MGLFHFKQFNIDQTNAVHKIGTDGCLMGMLLEIGEAKQILDIGTGTGLIALMLAQRCQAHITGIELLPEIAKMADGNFKNSPWKNRLAIENIDLLAYASKSDVRFDWIVSNPPYFKNASKSNNQDKNIARHQTENLIEEWLLASKKLLSLNGKIALILPTEIANEAIEKGKAMGLYLYETINIFSFENESCIRKIIVLSNEFSESLSKDFIIYKASKTYTEAYISIAKDYFTIF